MGLLAVTVCYTLYLVPSVFSSILASIPNPVEEKYSHSSMRTPPSFTKHCGMQNSGGRVPSTRNQGKETICTENGEEDEPKHKAKYKCTTNIKELTNMTRPKQ
ncbi:hypothetical protein ILYODFUR_018735 [Ilyodon furcidens]|uniref:Uncharacterized protein n=1 Tax=Ilyodon furcidens TaxID=33524 RepID=A0ABV0VGP6_9TELE